MNIWTKIKNFFSPVEPQPTYVEKMDQIIREEKEKLKTNPPKKVRKPRAKKVKNENTE